MGAMKSDGHAVQAFGEMNYEAMPKSVLAMLAYSFAQRLTHDGNRDAIMAEIAREWDALHANGIVPQKPKRLETAAQEADRIEGYSMTQCQDRLGEVNRERVASLRAMAGA